MARSRDVVVCVTVTLLDGYPGHTASLRRSLSGFAIRKRALPNSGLTADTRCCALTPRSFRVRARGRLIATHGSYTLTSVKLGCNQAGPPCRRCPRRNRHTTRGLRHLAQTRCLCGRTLFETRCRDRGGDCHGRPPCGTLGKGERVCGEPCAKARRSLGWGGWIGPPAP